MIYERLKDWCQRIGWDKWAHVVVFCLLSKILGWWLDWWLVALVCACFGVVKEVWDKARGGRIDKGDLIADAVGILIGVCL